MAYLPSVLALVPFTEGVGSPVDVVRSHACVLSGATWTTNAAGPCLACTATANFITLGTEGTDLTLPTGAITILLIRRKRDTTARAAAAVATNLSSGTTRCSLQAPHSDGNIYWDYGGTSGASRTTWTGYTETTNVERWAVSQGAAAGKIYLAGTLQATGSGAATRTAGTGVVRLNQGVTLNGDLADYNYLAILNEQWADATVAAWAAAADPVAFLEVATGHGALLAGYRNRLVIS